MASTGLDSKAS